MNKKAIEAIEKYNMINFGDTVIAALSGGADSVSLIHILNDIKEKYNLKIIAAHVNHNLRNEESLRDEQFCKELCENLNIPLKIKNIDIKKIAIKKKYSLEMCGREERYKFFNELAAEFSNVKIATAHTLSDSIETVILNLTRGTGLKGLCGISPVRENIIRPLIMCTRQDVEEYCEKNSFKFVIDKTNLDENFTRNKIRLNVIPQLKKINPSFENTMINNILLFKADENIIKMQVKDIVKRFLSEEKIKVDNILEYPVALQQRIIRKIISSKISVNITKIQTEKIMDLFLKGGALMLNSKYKVIVKNNFIEIKKINPNKDKVYWSCEIKEGDNYFKNNYNCKVKIEDIKHSQTDKINKKLLNNHINYDIIYGNLKLRSRVNGDKFKPANRGVTKTLKKLFNEYKIPADKRDEIIILADDLGILWIDGFGPDERATIKDNTKKILSFKIFKNIPE